MIIFQKGVPLHISAQSEIIASKMKRLKRDALIPKYLENEFLMVVYSRINLFQTQLKKYQELMNEKEKERENNTDWRLASDLAKLKCDTLGFQLEIKKTNWKIKQFLKRIYYL